MPTRALIIGNGEPPSRYLFNRLCTAETRIFCADGGANIMAQYGRLPDYIVGDLDSVEPEALAQVPEKRRIRIDADSTGTDLNKVLQFAADHGVTEAVLLAVTGRRVDHTMWNVSLLKMFQRRMQLRIVDEYCETRLIDGRIRFRAAVGQKLSLCPLSGEVRGVTTRGLRWPLDNERLAPGVRDGISNEVVENPVIITVAQGDLLLCVQWEAGGGEIFEEGEA